MLLSWMVTFTRTLSPMTTPHVSVMLRGRVRFAESVLVLIPVVSVPFAMITELEFVAVPLRPNESVGNASQSKRSLLSCSGNMSVLSVCPAISSIDPVPSLLRHQRYVAVGVSPGSGSLRSGLHVSVSSIVGTAGVRLVATLGAWLTKNGAVAFSSPSQFVSLLHAYPNHD